IPAAPRVMTPAAWIALYTAALRRSGAPPAAACLEGLAEQAAVDLAALDAHQYIEPVLCHSDLHRLNVVLDGAPVLLDWEYAHVSDAFWDLAGWSANNDWSAAAARAFLA